MYREVGPFVLAVGQGIGFNGSNDRMAARVYAPAYAKHLKKRRMPCYVAQDEQQVFDPAGRKLRSPYEFSPVPFDLTSFAEAVRLIEHVAFAFFAPFEALAHEPDHLDAAESLDNPALAGLLRYYDFAEPAWAAALRQQPWYRARQAPRPPRLP